MSGKMPREKKFIGGNGKAAAPMPAREPVQVDFPEAVYTADQSILIVGDGNLSFACALCTVLGSGSKVTSTTYDTLEELKKYPETEDIIKRLNSMGSRTFHGVDATDLATTFVGKLHQDGESSPDGASAAIAAPKFDRILFQFPLAHPPATHAEYMAQPDPVTQNKILLRKFLVGATRLLAPNAEIHITSKEVKPYAWWRIHTLANGLAATTFVGKYGFDPTRYPGYESRKPVNLHSDRVESFEFTNVVVFVFAAVTGLEAAPSPKPPYYCAICEIDATEYAAANMWRPSAIQVCVNFADALTSHIQPLNARLSPGNLASHVKGKKHKLFAAIAGRYELALAELGKDADS